MPVSDQEAIQSKEQNNPTPDFYLNEEGFVVFTAAYHLKRGYCCGNECKHCPFGEKPTLESLK